MSAPSERRVAAGIVVASVVVFVGLLAVVSPFYRSFDESKYLGIGYSMLAGHGPRTVFGAVFLPHSPLWPMIVTAPNVWFGIDAFDWGHLLNAIAGVGVLVAVAILGWRIRPVVGALAAVGYLAVPYLHDLTRTARLDVPAAALALAYLVVGIDAVRRGSVRRGLIAGAIFAIAFLIKEIALPFAPVPFLVGILAGRPLSSIARVAAAVLAVAIVGTSWWFALFASLTRQVYRLGTPAWTLIPLLIIALIAIVVGLAAPSLATRPEIERVGEGIRRRVPARLRAHGRAWAGWGLGLAWFAALTLFFDRNSELKGNGLFQPGQYALYVTTWLPQLVLVVLFGAVGVVLGLVARQRSSGAEREGLDAMLMATLCSAPLVLLVIAVGEPPRNYLAQIGLLTVIAAVGWLRALEWALTTRRSVVTVVVFVGVGAAAGAIVAQALPALSLRIGLPVGALAGLAIAFRPTRTVVGPADAAGAADTAGRRPGLSGATLAGALVAVLLMATTVRGRQVRRELDRRQSAAGDEDRLRLVPRLRDRSRRGHGLPDGPAPSDARRVRSEGAARPHPAVGPADRRLDRRREFAPGTRVLRLPGECLRQGRQGVGDLDLRLRHGPDDQRPGAARGADARARLHRARDHVVPGHGQRRGDGGDRSPHLRGRSDPGRLHQRADVHLGRRHEPRCRAPGAGPVHLADDRGRACESALVVAESCGRPGAHRPATGLGRQIGRRSGAHRSRTGH